MILSYCFVKRCEERLSCGHRCPSLCGENCPDASFCRECSLTRRQQVVDLITFAKYEDHDVDEEPIIVLPCKHFFTTSTLDGHLEIDRVYETDELGKPLKGLKPLSGIDVSEKPKQCPECRCVIHSVRRYGRVLRLAELRSLERKHMMMVNQALLILSKRVERTWDDRTVNKLRELEREIRKSPMRRVFEACRGAVAMDTSPPPSAPLIRCIELQGIVFCARISAYNDDNFQKARATYEEAIAIADASFSSRSGAQLRIALGSLIAKFCDDVNRAQAMVFPLLDWVIDHHVQFQDLVDCSNALKVKLTKEYKINELRQILESVSSIGGYDYGGSASSHWFECRNGHPYYIGECGRAMEKSRCIECNEPVGGSSHTLLSSNRGVTGVVRDALAGL